MKFKVTVFVVAVLVLFSMTMSAQMMPDMGAGGGEDLEETVATVNEEEVDLQQLEMATGLQQLLMQLMQADPQFAGFLLNSEAGQEFMTQYRREVLDNLIDEILLQQKAEEMGIEITQERKDEVFAEIEEQLEGQREQQGMTEEEQLQQLDQNIPEEQLETMDDLKEIIIEDSNIKVEILLEEHVLTEMDEDLEGDQLHQQELEQQEEYEEYIAELRAEADIEVDEQFFQ